MVNHYSLLNKFIRIYTNFNYQKMITFYIYHQEEIFKIIGFLILLLDNIQNFMILSHMLVIFKIRLISVF